jgi:CRP-like cAMP-binding protein
MLANEANETERQLIELAYSSVRRKVANALIMLMDKNGEQEEGKTVIQSSSRDQLAALAGTAKETLIRTLSSFKSEGLIELHDNSITILLPDKLRSMPQ